MISFFFFGFEFNLSPKISDDDDEDELAYTTNTWAAVLAYLPVFWSRMPPYGWNAASVLFFGVKLKYAKKRLRWVRSVILQRHKTK